MTNEISIKLDQGYMSFLNAIKTRLVATQLKLAQSINKQIVTFYWQLGKDILDMQAANATWGSKFLDQLSKDLQTANPGMNGFSKRSLEYMRLLATIYPDESQFAQQPAAQLPWSHTQLLIDKFRDDPARFQWYAKSTIVNGWSRSTLNMHIKSELYERQSAIAEKSSNYLQLLPPPQSDLAHEMLKNPYSFDFLTISKDAQEREIENALTKHIKQFLLELGEGFSFVGNQVPLEVDGQSFFIDLLFYHYKLRSFVVIELKAKEFKPADLGQLSFYLSAVDEMLRHQQDNPSIGILLCESRSKIIAEYALKKINAPIGVSEYILSKALPKELKTSLPSIEEIENELNSAVKQDDDNKENT